MAPLVQVPVGYAQLRAFPGAMALASAPRGPGRRQLTLHEAFARTQVPAATPGGAGLRQLTLAEAFERASPEVHRPAEEEVEDMSEEARALPLQFFTGDDRGEERSSVEVAPAEVDELRAMVFDLREELRAMRGQVAQLTARAKEEAELDEEPRRGRSLIGYGPGTRADVEAERRAP